MELDYKALMVWGTFANLAWSILLTVYVRYATRNRVTDTAIEAILKSHSADRLEIEKRFGAVTAELARRLTHEDIAPVYDRVNEMAQALSGVEGQIKGMHTSVQMIHEYLLNQGKQK